MVEEYLEKLYQEFYERKLNLEQEHQRREVWLRNNKKFIHILEESLDEDFEKFSPRNVDEESHRKIESLKKEQKNITDSINELQKEILSNDKKIEELEKVLEDFRLNQSYINVPSNQEDNLIDEFQEENLSENQRSDTLHLENIKNSLLPEFVNFSHKIEMCNKLINVDLIRCKLELTQIEKDVNDIILKLKKIKK